MAHFVQQFGRKLDKPFFKKAGWVFLPLVILLFIGNDARLIKAAYEADGPPAGLILLFYIPAFFSCFALLQSKKAWVRVLFRILLFSAIYTDGLYLLIGNFPFSYPDAINLFNNPAYASSSLTTFKAAFLLAFAGAAVFFALVMLSVRRFSFSFTGGWLLLFIALQALAFGYAKKHPGAHDFLPALYRVTGNLLAADRIRAEDKWRREEVAASPVQPGIKHVFLVVDESVEGSCLSVNGFALNTTPFLQKQAKQFINFGLASSFTNASAGSNLSLLSGMRMCELPDQQYLSFRKPTLFQYARKAGYQTFLLDGQANGHTLQNYNTRKDLHFVDSLYQPGAAKEFAALYMRDSMLAEKIVQLACSTRPTFAYVNKQGAHWPYKNNFPPGLRMDHFNELENKKGANAAPYFSSVFWNVDRFWQSVATKLAGQSGVLILYTSDHGENYAAGALNITHASIYNAGKIEGQVPLLAYDHAGFFPAGFSPDQNGYSHESLFPTLLSAMGYDSCFVRQQYGKTLLEKPSQEPRWFLTGDLFGRGKNSSIFIDPLPFSCP
ncbi:MAG: sulfatase-like hydrolase/transferase [Williamsia sp.]|nr:sulfatase-like hydrolase/transferase [Williamsia sp.]